MRFYIRTVTLSLLLLLVSSHNGNNPLVREAAKPQTILSSSELITPQTSRQPQRVLIPLEEDFFFPGMTDQGKLDSNKFAEKGMPRDVADLCIQGFQMDHVTDGQVIHFLTVVHQQNPFLIEEGLFLLSAEYAPAYSEDIYIFKIKISRSKLGKNLTTQTVSHIEKKLQKSGEIRTLMLPFPEHCSRKEQYLCVKKVAENATPDLLSHICLHLVNDHGPYSTATFMVEVDKLNPKLVEDALIDFLVHAWRFERRTRFVNILAIRGIQGWVSDKYIFHDFETLQQEHLLNTIKLKLLTGAISKEEADKEKENVLQNPYRLTIETKMELMAPYRNSFYYTQWWEKRIYKDAKFILYNKIQCKNEAKHSILDLKADLLNIRITNGGVLHSFLEKNEHITLPRNVKDIILTGRINDLLIRDAMFYHNTQNALCDLTMQNTLFINYTGHIGVGAALAEKGIPIYYQILGNETTLNQLQDYNSILRNNTNTKASSAAILLWPNHGGRSWLDRAKFPPPNVLSEVHQVVVFTEAKTERELILEHPSTKDHFHGDPEIYRYLTMLAQHGKKVRIIGVDNWGK